MIYNEIRVDFVIPLSASRNATNLSRMIFSNNLITTNVKLCQKLRAYFLSSFFKIGVMFAFSHAPDIRPWANDLLHNNVIGYSNWSHCFSSRGNISSGFADFFESTFLWVFLYLVWSNFVYGGHFFIRTLKYIQRVMGL